MTGVIFRAFLWAVVVAVVVLTPACEISVTGPPVSPELVAALQVAAAVM